MRTLAPGDAAGISEFRLGPRARHSKTREAFDLASEMATTVTAVARLIRRKGYLASLAVLSKLRSSIGKRLGWLVIVPDGEADHVDELKTTIADSDCGVRLMGPTSCKKIRGMT